MALAFSFLTGLDFNPEMLETGFIKKKIYIETRTNDIYLKLWNTYWITLAGKLRKGVSQAVAQISCAWWIPSSFHLPTTAEFKVTQEPRSKPSISSQIPKLGLILIIPRNQAAGERSPQVNPVSSCCKRHVGSSGRPSLLQQGGNHRLLLSRIGILLPFFFF